MYWTKVQCNNNALLCFAKDILDSVAKLKLDWCVALQLTGPNFGGWVSENYLDLARLIRWFFFKLPYLKDDPPYEEPKRSYTTWNAAV